MKSITLHAYKDFVPSQILMHDSSQELDRDWICNAAFLPVLPVFSDVAAPNSVSSFLGTLFAFRAHFGWLHSRHRCGDFIFNPRDSGRTRKERF